MYIDMAMAANFYVLLASPVVAEHARYLCRSRAGKQGVAAIGTAEVARVLEPIWRAKPETASRLRGRIEAVLDYAAARGWRTGENPARWRGHLAKLLPSRAKLARVKHHAALPWQDIPAFMEALDRKSGVAALALRFTILTAARTGEIIGARWAEVDIGKAVWTIRATRMKAGRDHRVPLSEPAIVVLREIVKLGSAPDAFLFPGAKSGKPLSNMAMAMLLGRMGRDDLTVHGFRARSGTGAPRPQTRPANLRRRRWRTHSKTRWKQRISAGTYSRSAGV